MLKDEDIIEVAAPQLTAAERLYLPQVAGGMWVTLVHLFKRPITVKYPEDHRPRRAIETARAWSRGEATVGEARKASVAAHAAARDSADAAAREAARAAGHAVATAHMADHELGAAAYAIKAVRLASFTAEAMAAGERECRWQREQLPDAIRELVLSDAERRNSRLWSVFTG